MRQVIFALALALAACGGKSKPPPPPSGHAGAVPLVGLEDVTFGESPDEVIKRFPGAYLEGDRVFLEKGAVENLPAVVMFGFQQGILTSLTVAFDTECEIVDLLGEQLDAHLGKRTSAEAGIASWNQAGWDLALYCAHGDEGEFPRLDVRPAF
jgi:hypothetical protein